jgi:hypothetical protein
MPEAWSSKFDRQRATEARRIDHNEEGKTARQVDEEAEEAFSTETDEPRGRRVAD